MSGAELKQRLAAILAADVAGYSRLMATNDWATVAALDSARAVFRTQIETTGGRVIDMAGDPEQEYFADGMVEDIITALSRFQRLFVIARNTSFTFKGRSVDMKTVARELGVHFVLEGSVRKASDRVRITAQLIDGGTGQHVWAERYEDVLSDVFELQERISRQIVGSMVPEIEAEEMRLLERSQRRFTEADDISWRAAKALSDVHYTGQPALTIEAIRLAEQAIEHDPNCRLAWYVLSASHNWRVFYGWTQDRAGSIEAARDAAETLMRLAPNDSRSYFQRGVVDVMFGDFPRGAGDIRRALDAARQPAQGWAGKLR